MDIFLKKTYNNIYQPFGNDDFDRSAKIPPETLLKATSIKGRNYMFLKKYFALLKFALEHKHESLEHIQTIDQIHTEIKLRTGEYELYVMTNGKPFYKPKSISYEAMDEEEFSGYYSRALDVITKYFCYDLEKNVIERELINFY